MSEPQSTKQTSNTSQPARVGSANLTNTHEPEDDVRPIEAGEETSDTFQAVYTGFDDDDIEVEIVKRVPASQSPHQFGHAIIDRPEWDETKTALFQNVRVDVLDSGEEVGFDA
ncbi:hypothetical protein SAMN06266787_11421 [Halorubrum ezzemoulense]|uniref:Uncharacterized protein n=1 Tax=Halorubrum ezzemoulense TaxID=337243 RepID=A0A238YLW5_HALEZ|nr:hypothetical protein [Halorubrum ezzemoulense]SNR71701.1 hypothetical protein SAMN06266787_11421 [Halorubrum ezzemoulense]